jgi:hypothetical protein
MDKIASHSRNYDHRNASYSGMPLQFSLTPQVVSCGATVINGSLPMTNAHGFPAAMGVFAGMGFTLISI